MNIEKSCLDCKYLKPSKDVEKSYSNTGNACVWEFKKVIETIKGLPKHIINDWENYPIANIQDGCFFHDCAAWESKETL